MRRALLHLLMFLGLAGCAAPVTLPPAPTPQIVRIALAPEVKPVEKAIYACAESLPGLAVFVDPVPASEIDRSAYEISIFFGQLPETFPFMFQLTTDALVVLVNSANPMQEVTGEALKGLYSGKVSMWDELTPGAPFSQAVTLIDYADENELHRLFFTGIGLDEKVSSERSLAPNPQALLELVSEQPGAVGYLPRSWLQEPGSMNSTRILSVDADLEAKFSQPILAGASAEPGGVVAGLLDCLQSP